MNNRAWGIFVLCLFHVSGVIGIFSPLRDWFLALTPVNLLVSFGILTYFHQKKNLKFLLLMILIMIGGFAIEVLGVNTGWPFGDYTYGAPLGYKWMGTPFMIGVNWFIMAYCGAMLFKGISKYNWLNAFFSGLTITALDIIIEPVAIYLDFWTWEATAVPIQNYVAWTVCISLFSYLIYYFGKDYKNRISNWVLGVQMVFFLSVLIGSTL